MQRRKFCKDSLSGLPLLFLAPSLFSSACNNESKTSDKSVIVIGAGISGLAAAKKLKEKGLKVTVLEAQDKVGGRLRTNRSLGIAFDEGASWIHGTDGNPITTLAKEAGMETYHTIDENRKSYDIGGTARNAGIYDNAEDELYSILEALSKKGSATKSFETVFNESYPTYANDRLWQFFLSTYITFDTGDLDNLSSLLYNEGEEYGGEERIATNGYDTIPIFLSKDLDIQLNQKVSKIDYNNEKIQVQHNGAVSEADYVLVTVPLGVLKANVIDFSPTLPATKTTAIQKLGMNCVNKFLLKWDTTFWDDVQYISYTPSVKDKFNYFVNVNKWNADSHALMTFAYADYARLTESMSDAQVIEDIMIHLKDIYGNNTPYPSQLLRTKWQSNEYTFGAYSYTAVGSEMRHFDDIAESVNDKLFFAGEHTEADYFSTAHGAYLSGIREANKIIALL